ncbi:MAG: hypothetical protein AB1513_00130 [Pseudomonadota bacterium]
MPHVMKDQEVSMLREEMEMLMRERESLLQVVGAAAMFVADMDSAALPENTYNDAELLAESLNALREETLRDALQAVRKQPGD